MSVPLIHVRPPARLRVPFARWAVAQQPKVRTVDGHAFAVPPGLYTHMPERLLLGALVDGQAYVPVPEEPLDVELLGVATAEGLSAPQDAGRQPEAPVDAHSSTTPPLGATPTPPRPEVPGDEIGPEPIPLPIPSPPTESANQFAAGTADERPLPHGCSRCQRRFATERGRDIHHRRAHRETLKGAVAHAG